MSIQDFSILHNRDPVSVWQEGNELNEEEGAVMKELGYSLNETRCVNPVLSSVGRKLEGNYAHN